MARRHRSVRSLRDLQIEAEAAEAQRREAESSARADRSKSSVGTKRSTPVSQPRSRIVWAVCDIGGRSVATFPYRHRAEADAHAAQLKAKGKGNFFVRSIKEPMTPE